MILGIKEEPSPPEKKKKKHDYEAPDLTDFNVKDLDANWDGFLSEFLDPDVNYASKHSLEEFRNFVDEMGQIYYAAKMKGK